MTSIVNLIFGFSLGWAVHIMIGHHTLWSLEKLTEREKQKDAKKGAWK